MTRSLTFRKEASVAIVHMTTQEPAIAKIVVPLNELNAITLCKTQFIGTPSNEVIWQETNHQPRSWP